MQSFFNILLYYFDILPCIIYTFKQPIVLFFEVRNTHITWFNFHCQIVHNLLIMWSLWNIKNNAGSKPKLQYFKIFMIKIPVQTSISFLPHNTKRGSQKWDAERIYFFAIFDIWVNDLFKSVKAAIKDHNYYIQQQFTRIA